jgi:hypothetical protein
MKSGAGKRQSRMARQRRRDIGVIWLKSTQGTGPMRQAVIFVLASSALVAAVATAHVAAPLPEGTSFRTVVSKAEAAPAPAAPVNVQPKSSFEAKQAPVPLLARERAAWAGPPVLEAAAPNSTTAVPAVANEEGNRFAKGAIEADGYKGVRDITPGPDGSFRARAMRGRTEVTITVDREGRVSAN